MATLTNFPLPALDRLDGVQHLHELERFEPAPFLSALEEDLGTGDETLGTLTAQLDALHRTLSMIDAFTSKAMAIQLTHLFATEPVSPQLRTLIATTVTAYAGDMKLLRERFARSMSKGLLESLIATAESVLDLRHTLRAGVLVIVKRVAAAQAAWLDQAARDRSLQDADRLRLRLARVDLGLLHTQPERLAQASFEARIKQLPPPEEEIEIDKNEDVAQQRFALLEID